MSTTTTETERSRRLTFLTVTFFLMAGVLFGGALYLRSRSQGANARAAHIAEVAAFNRAIEPTDPEVKRRVAQFRVLREKWRPWALKHQDELRQMLSAKPDDQRALDAVWQVVPADPDKAVANFTLKSLQQSGVKFSWQPGSKRWKSGDKDKEAMEVERKQIFANHQDIVLTRSVNAGRSQTVFWVSGRVTQNDRIKNPKRGKGAPALIEAPPQELEPPYDFLQ